MKPKININKRNIRNYAIVLFAGLLFGWMLFHNSGATTEATHQHSEHAEEATIWTCSMHPQIRIDKPGKCPICSMDLIQLKTNSDDDNTANNKDVVMNESAMKLAEIQTTTVKMGLPHKALYLLGKVKPDERRLSELTARFGGRIEKLYVNFTGQKVRKGEKLATIYSPELVTAQKELLEAKEYKDNNPSLYNAAVSKLRLWDLTDAQINNIEKSGKPQLYFNVLSPISGTVTQRHIAKGDYVNEGDALFKVVDLTHLWVMFEAYESDLPWLNKGDKADFTVQSLPGETFSGKVTFIDPFLDPVTHVNYVRVEVSNPQMKLKPEMFARGIIYPEVSNDKQVLLIPKTAVLWTGKRSVVYVKVQDRENATFNYREIVTGPDAGDYYVVNQGLSEGEEIAVNGVFKIDAASQLEGKPSMMDPPTDETKTMNMDKESNMNMSTMDNNTHSDNMEHVMFKVYGNCEMCKDRIETAAKSVAGVNTAMWDMDTKEIHVNYNKDKTTVEAIHNAIARIGHDTDLEKADDDVYNNLPECCLYRNN